VVFTLAIVFSTSTQGALLGAVVGLAISLAIAFVIYRLGHKLNLSRFFTVIGALLMFFAAGLLADAVQNMQELGWLNFLTQPLWHTGGVLSEDGTLGDIAHSFVGYADSPTALQLLVYVCYLAAVLFFFLRVGRRPKTTAGPAAAGPARTSPASVGPTPVSSAPVGSAPTGPTPTSPTPTSTASTSPAS
jgi:high-affinity iron transporter